MKEITVVDENRNVMTVSLLGFFSILELQKEFVMYSFVDDDTNNPDGYILLGEVIRNDDNIQILGIIPEEERIVLAYYNEISKQIGDDNDE